MWQTIKAEVNKHGPEKTVTQCKNNIRNLKAAYKAAKENNKRSLSRILSVFQQFRRGSGTKDVINLPHIAELGVEREEVDFE